MIKEKYKQIKMF